MIMPSETIARARAIWAQSYEDDNDAFGRAKARDIRANLVHYANDERAIKAIAAALTEAERLRAENERLTAHIATGVLPGLLNDEEKDALVDFIKFLRKSPPSTSRGEG